MKILVTGGAGFIGRWIVKKLLDKKCDVWVIDDLSNGRKENVEEFEGNPCFKGLVEGSITNRNLVSDIFKKKFDICIHCAAVIEVQDSINNPAKAVEVNVNGTFNILEESRRHKTKLVLISTCMIYDLAGSNGAINENHATKP